MAQEMGTGLGQSEILFRSVPPRRDMSGTLRLVLGDQLTWDVSSLVDVDPARDVVLMVEVAAEARYVRHHKQKIVLVLSAMRHFAQALRERGVRVDYVTLDDPANTQTFGGELARAVVRHDPEAVVVTEPGEWRVWQMMQDWSRDLSVPVIVRPDDRFFCSRPDFAQLAQAGKTTRMEFFYREMRRRTAILMTDGGPEGGQWNFDQDNRKPLPKGVKPPDRLRFAPDETTQAVMRMVSARFHDHFGDIAPFGWAVTRDDALRSLHHFITHSLPQFGDYQDAMKAGDDFLYHSLISPYLNLGLLNAREVCLAAQDAFRQGQAPLNAVEGFIRQILGWREFVRGIYWTQMPAYAQTNDLDATVDLPSFYWTGQTPMRCMAECIGATRRNAYAHHIQRLMVTGNFALLAGVQPAQVAEWYLEVYADAFEWVELPNVQGMVLHADGGLLGSKPYAASGAYIRRMSDYCTGCAFDVRRKTGPEACPFNYLYWNFMIRHEARFAQNPRMAMVLRNLARLSGAERDEIRRNARDFLAGQQKPPPDQLGFDLGW